MKNKLQITLLLSLVVLLSSFTDKTKENKTETTTATASFGQLKAALKSPTGKAYFFTDKKYYRQNLRTDKLEKSAVINGNFKGLVNSVDAALLHTNGKGYFFKGSKYYRYNFYTNKVDKTDIISKNWKGVPNNVDAAVVHSNGKAYFFKGSTYYRYNSSTRKVDKTAAISTNWKGVPNNVEAALLHTNGKIYFFKGNKYYRYSISAKKVDKVGTIGVDGWKGLSFTKTSNNATASTKDNIRLKVTLTRIKSIQARDSDDIADFTFQQFVDYKTKGNQKRAIEKKIKVGSKDVSIRIKEAFRINKEAIAIINTGGSQQIHVREGDENHIINNSLVYEITPQEIADKRAEFKIKTALSEVNSEGIGLFEKNTYKYIAKYGRNDIEVSINEVLEYLQNPRATKYRSSSYFKGGRGGDMHEYGAYGNVMWMKKGSNNSLIGHLEFGDNNKETYVRLYYRFELVQ
ncbi:hemopexin repeat-containing protein [Aureibaculum luteum]|uniref:hemopexin repeat-containing protein n=1 Tax=Aureibaculum luteum TaxID=1548456 RepID=UPI000E4672B3|nr:hemopexin repeat-containing protein [Aureibaculum luteum]